MLLAACARSSLCTQRPVAVAAQWLCTYVLPVLLCYCVSHMSVLSADQCTVLST
jgi:hypothetical protein